MSDRWEWVEIIEPRTRERMYANLTTGECLWDPPPGVRVKKTDKSHWWELYDQNTSRFYYYNATTQQTAWHRPQNCDIIPLAKLQTLKQNTEVADRRARREISTQTADAGQKRDQLSTNNVPSSSHQGSRHHARSNHRSHSRQVASSSSPVSGDLAPENGHRSSHPRTSKTAPSSSSIVVNPGYEHQDKSNASASSAMRRTRESPRPQRYLTGSNVQLFNTSRSASDDDAMSRLPDFCKRPTALEKPQASSSSGMRSQMPDVICSQSPSSPPPLSQDFLPAGIAFHHSRNPSTFDRLGSPFDGPPLPNSNMISGEFFSDIIPPPTFQYPGPALAMQTTSAQVSQRPKTRAFPRTNPAYAGSRPREVVRTTYRNMGNDQSQMMQGMSVHGNRFQEGRMSDTVQNPPFPLDMAADRRRGFRHERSDSDTSHSSFGIGRLQQPDHSGLGYHNQRPSRERDPFSESQGSLSGLMSAESLSSQGSGRGGFAEGSIGAFASSPYDSLSSSHDSPCHRIPTEVYGSDPYRHQMAMHLVDKNHTQSAHGTPTARTRVRRNSEPDYANLPGVQQQLGKLDIVADPPLKSRDKAFGHCGISVNTGMIMLDDRLRSADGQRSADSLSPVEFVRQQQNTPSSVHSASTHESTSEGLPDQGFEDSDNSSIFSSPSPSSRRRLVPQSSQQEYEFQHEFQPRNHGALEMLSNTAQLQQQAISEQNCSPPNAGSGRPLSFVLSFQADDNLLGCLNMVDGNQRQVDIQQFVAQNLNEHRTGILGKAVSLDNMLTWTKSLIQKPMIRTTDKSVKKDAVEVFKQIQSYMGDRKAKTAPNQIALDIVSKGWGCVDLRDEIYIQLCRQTTENPRDESLMKGWELLSICLSIFPPTLRFHSYLEGYIQQYVEPCIPGQKFLINHYAAHCHRRLERILKSGAKRGLRKPTLDEIDQALNSIFHPSMFGNTLDEILQMQAERYPDRKLPWIQTTLSEEVLRLNGACVEGIFRVPGDIDEVNTLKVRCDQWQVPSGCLDPHSPASLLKLWYRELYEPLIPPEFYEECVKSYSDVDACLRIVQSLPTINRLVLSYLIRFLQVFAAPENAVVTKMDASNLAMVMAPNCLRCESDDPNVIFENTRKEMAFVRVLIQNLDTSFMDGVI